MQFVANRGQGGKQKGIEREQKGIYGKREK
jgi:hypothetical protein